MTNDESCFKFIITPLSIFIKIIKNQLILIKNQKNQFKSVIKNEKINVKYRKRSFIVNNDSFCQ